MFIKKDSFRVKILWFFQGVNSLKMNLIRFTKFQIIDLVRVVGNIFNTCS